MSVRWAAVCRCCYRLRCSWPSSSSCRTLSNCASRDSCGLMTFQLTDDLISWSYHIPLLGNHLSLFCLLFSITTVLNQIIMMKQQDMGNNPQLAAMKWMMYIMPVMFFFIFNDYASGLSYYYFISGLIGIITMWIMRRMTDEKKLLAQLEANKKEPSQQKASGLMG